jgi:DNA-directed RNA polymerase specialized sigma subunit
MNSELVSTFLENFHELQSSKNPENAFLIWDINVAIWNAPLTNEERRVIQRLYIDPPAPPERDKLAKNGFTNGRPHGGTTQSTVGERLGIEKSTLSNIKKSAIDKIAQYLGTAYGDDGEQEY